MRDALMSELTHLALVVMSLRSHLNDGGDPAQIKDGLQDVRDSLAELEHLVG